MAEPLRLALVGCGGIARAYAEALRRVPALRPVAVVDPAPAARAALGGLVAAPQFVDLDALWRADLRLDAALVLTPPDTHEPLCCRLLAAGAHTLCEKPLAPTVAAAARMQGIARTAQRLLMLGSKFRYTADVVAARKLVAAGAIGAIVRGEIVFAARVDMRHRWHSDPARAGGGVLMDNGSHAADLARCLLGPITRVSAAFAPRVQPLAVEDTVQLQFVTEGGTLGTVDLSWSLQPDSPTYVRLLGADGTIEIGWRQSRWRRHGDEWLPFGGGYDKVAAFAAQLADFAAACAGTAAPGIDDADAMAAALVVASAYRSAHEQRWVDVPPAAPASTANPGPA